MPEEGARALAEVEEPAEDHGDEREEAGRGSEDHGELGVADLVFDVSRLAREQLVALEVLEVFGVGVQRRFVGTHEANNDREAAAEDTRIGSA